MRSVMAILCVAGLLVLATGCDEISAGAAKAILTAKNANPGSGGNGGGVGDMLQQQLRLRDGSCDGSGDGVNNDFNYYHQYLTPGPHGNGG